PCKLDLWFGSCPNERSQIVEILWAMAIVSREHLECDEMAASRHGHLEVRDDLDPLCGRRDLGFDAGGSEQKVDNDVARGRGAQARRRQTLRLALLDDRRDAVSTRCLQLTHQPFCVAI